MAVLPLDHIDPSRGAASDRTAVDSRTEVIGKLGEIRLISHSPLFWQGRVLHAVSKSLRSRLDPSTGRRRQCVPVPVIVNRARFGDLTLRRGPSLKQAYMLPLKLAGRDSGGARVWPESAVAFRPQLPDISPIGGRPRRIVAE